MTPFDDRICRLGEGPFWHPLREQLFWFDILGNRLLSREGDRPLEWQFAENVSAAGWIDAETLLIASESALFRFDLATGRREDLCALEADRPANRSNDGRADPQGGFWIGTMGKAAEPGAGAIYRYHRGELRCLFPGVSIPNAICFTPDGGTAQFADGATGLVMRVALDAEGWPRGEPWEFLDFAGRHFDPDGAVIDSAGVLWIALWGAGRIAAYDAEGAFLDALAVPAPRVTCPAFGGAEMTVLHCTTAWDGMDDAARAAAPGAGRTFMAEGIAKGQAEHRIRL